MYDAPEMKEIFDYKKGYIRVFRFTPIFVFRLERESKLSFIIAVSQNYGGHGILGFSLSTISMIKQYSISVFPAFQIKMRPNIKRLFFHLFLYQ